MKRPRREPRRSPQGPPRFGTPTIVILLLAFTQVVAGSRPQVTGKELSFSTFLDLAEHDRVRDARILDVDSYIVGSYRRGAGLFGVRSGARQLTERRARSGSATWPGSGGAGLLLGMLMVMIASIT